MRRTASLAAVAVLAAAIIALPAAASASTGATIYPPTNSCTTTPSAFVAGGTVEFACADGTFGANEEITITVRGENGAAVAFARAAFAVTTGSTVRESSEQGALAPVAITFPADAVGVYNIEAISASSAGGTASASVVDASGLPATGGDARTSLGLWVGGGALVAAGATIALASALRRARDAR
ncbi:cell wall protein [Microbacterium arborescens]